MSDVKEYFKGLGSFFSKNEGEFLKLIPLCKQFDHNQVKQIYKALYKAAFLHEGQVRKSGEAYINHPIGAASVLASYGLDYEVVCAALLHDTIEDTDYTLSECEKDFGYNITKLVDGATKIGQDVNLLTQEKILNSIKLDVRSIAVKSGDRLHNMYTLNALKEKKQKEIANETKDFYIPVVKILGIYKLKDEFQDLCLYYLNNEEFLKYHQKRRELKMKYDYLLRKIGDDTQEKLSKLGIAMNYEYRVKNTGGIYYELQNSKSLEEIEDLLAIKMVLKEVEDCYLALDIIKKNCDEMIGYYDYINNPKFNGYSSINLNAIYSDVDTQIRIRTDKMQARNNLGVFSDFGNAKLNEDMQKHLDVFSKQLKICK